MSTHKAVWSRSFFPVLLTYFVDNFGQAVVYPIFTPLFLRPHLNFLSTDVTLFHRTLLLGLLIASFPLAQFFGAPLLGELSDRVGRKKVFIATIIGGIIGYFLTGLGIHLKEIHLLWTGRALAGFFAGNLTLCLAAIADITKTKQQRAYNFGWIGVIAGLGFILAILTGGSLSNPNLVSGFRPEIPFFITGILSCINLAVMLRFFQESHKVKQRDKLDIWTGVKNIGCALQTKGVRIIYTVYFLFMICWVTSLQFLSAYLIDNFNASTNTITLTFVLIGITWSFANFVLNPILSKFLSSSKTLFFGLLVLSAFLFLTLIHHQPKALFLTHFFIASLAAALCWTNGLATLSIKASKFIQGSILGVNQSVVAVAFIIGPIIGGFLAGIDIHKLYTFTASCALLAALLLFIPSFGIKRT